MSRLLWTYTNVYMLGIVCNYSLYGLHLIRGQVLYKVESVDVAVMWIMNYSIISAMFHEIMGHVPVCGWGGGHVVA
jgi:hypothetical protein